jgi:hypothetical protein
MRKRNTALPVALAFSLALAHDGSAQLTSVHIEVGEAPAGKGVAVSRGVDCFVLTARHVVEAPRPLRVVGEGRRSSTGTMTWSDPESDLAAVRVDDPAAICGRDYLVPVSGFWSRIGSAGSGTLQVRTELGQQDNIPVALLRGLRPVDGTPRSIFIRPAESYIDLGQGLSGSLLVVAGQPAGLLVQVSTDGLGRGRVIPLPLISALVGDFLPLTASAEEEARFNPVLAADILRKNVNYVETGAFCRALLRMARWVETPEERWEPEEFHYQVKRQSGGWAEYHIPSWLLPDQVTVYRRSPDGAHRTAETRLGYAPESLDASQFWARATNAIHSCIGSEARKEFDLRLRSRRTGDNRSNIEWSLDRTGTLGVVVDDVDIWLVWAGYGELAIRVWDID